VLRRWFWPSFAFPGVAWLVLLFLVPTYAVLAVAFGTVDPIFSNPVPVWSPLHWQGATMRGVLGDLRPGHPFWTVTVRTFAYVGLALVGCLLIGYPVAYYLARHARRTKGLLLVLLIVPFWVSYLMRMLAWVGLLLPDGLVNRVLLDLRVVSQPVDWLNGQSSSVVLALIYGYVPYLILPLYAVLDRIEPRVLEAGRDLGASPVSTFLHVTLPLSRHGILAASVLIALPMFGDYYTNDVISGSPRTSMIGNQINLFFQGGPQRTVGAGLVIVLSVLLAALMSYYLWATVRASRTDAAVAAGL
jgi:ABC-type spermidine/putrescine transport system permease subunit I